MRKRKELTEKDIINYWLEKYHNTNMDKIASEHPDWRNDNPEYNSCIFYEAYPVTQEQHDEWRAWLLKKLMWFTGMGKKYCERAMWAVYLNTAPNIKEPTNENPQDTKHA